MADMVMELANVSREVAEEALAKHKEVWLAVDALMQKPVVAGDKYIPAKPKIDTGLSPEQEALCQKGRWLQEQINVVFSVAHSKIRTQPDQEEVPALEAGSLAPPSSPESEVVLPVLPQDFDGKSPPLIQQYESLH